MKPADATVLDAVFGEASVGSSLEERARSSALEYVRSLDQLTYWTPAATGRRLTALEAFETFGFDVLQEVASEGFAVISSGKRAAGNLIRERRELLGLDTRHLANSAKVDQEAIRLIEQHKRVPIRKVEAIARALSLDERLISWKATAARQDERVAVRLRTVGDEQPHVTPSAVATIAEAAWVASAQIRLQHRLGLQAASPLEHSENYGAPGYPPYRHGYYLAQKARQVLRLGDGALPCSLRELAEDRLGIPLIQAELGQSIAGVTVEIGDARAIVLNVGGHNRRVFVRRSTVAHELGHLLFDPPARLDTLRVDEYEELEQAAYQLVDPVEQRANAFGVELIAPQAAAVERYQAAGEQGLAAVMDHFGISQTAAKYQVWNGLERTVPLENITSGPYQKPAADWEAREEYTVGYHPLPGLRASRAGKFSAVVVRAAEEGLISWDSAAAMLESDESAVQRAAPAIQALFPAVFF